MSMPCTDGQSRNAPPASGQRGLRQRAFASSRYQRGVGLLEVLIAMLVLAVGFLAAGRMQIGALRNNQNAYHESQARMLLDDMIDRMRSNMAGVRADDYADKSTVDASQTDCSSTACNAASLAARDLYEWSVSLDPVVTNALPRLPHTELESGSEPAVGTISAPDTGVYTLTLSWQEMVDGVSTNRLAQATFIP